MIFTTRREQWKISFVRRSIVIKSWRDFERTMRTNRTNSSEKLIAKSSLSTAGCYSIRGAQHLAVGGTRSRGDPVAIFAWSVSAIATTIEIGQTTYTRLHLTKR